MTDMHAHKLNVAITQGYTGDKAVGFADLLQGDTPEEVTNYAERLTSVLGSLKPPAARATDPSQGRGGEASGPTPGQLFVQAMDDMAFMSREVRANVQNFGH
jgi:hypothetical protein